MELAGKMHIGCQRLRSEYLAAVLCLMLAGCAATLPELKTPLARDEELLILPTRPGVTVRIVLASPQEVPKGTFLFFPGSDGFSVNTEGRPRWGYIRSLSELGFITGIVDVPSDQPYGMWAGDRFKTSKEHVDDIKKIIDFVNHKWSTPIFLIGHSAGTISVAHFAAALKDHRISGVIFTGAPALLGRLPLQNITYPTLFVHHREDTCASFEFAHQQHHRLINSPRVTFIEVQGGDPSREVRCRRPDPAASSADPSGRKDYTHGFTGKEREVVMAIADWATGGPVADRIGP